MSSAYLRAVNRVAKEILKQGPALMTMHEATVIAKRQLAGAGSAWPEFARAVKR